jgi:hypothetical protein
VWRMLDGYTSGVRDIIMYNPTRVLDQPVTQLLGNAFTLAIHGKLREAAVMFRETARRVAGRPNGLVDPIVDQYELGYESRALFGIDPTLDPSYGDEASKLPFRRFTEDRMGRMLGATAGNWAGRGSTVIASENIRNMVRGVDRLAREAVFGVEFRKLVPEAWADFRQEALEFAGKRGRDTAEMRRVLDDLGGQFGATRVYAEMLGAFGDEGMATHLSRSWKAATNELEKKAVDEAKRLFFTGYERGRVDQAMRRLFMFHYFASRQSALYATQAMRHPGLLNAYANATQGLDRYIEENELPDTAKGFLRLFGTGFGVQMFFNPFLLASTYLSFNESGQQQSDDEGFSLMRFFKDLAFVNPLIEAALEYSNLDEFLPENLQDDRLVDPSGLSSMVRTGMAIYNQGVAMDLLPGRVLFEDPLSWFEQRVRQEITTRTPLPDAWAQNTGAANRDRFFHIVVAEAMDDGMTQAEATDAADEAILAGPGDDLYDRAMLEYTTGELGRTFINLAGPVAAQMRVGNRDQTMVANEVKRGDREQRAGGPEPTIKTEAGVETVAGPKTELGDTSPVTAGSMGPITYPGSDIPVAPNTVGKPMVTPGGGVTVPTGPPEATDMHTSEELAEMNRQLGETRGTASRTEAGRELQAQVDGYEEVGSKSGRESLATYNGIKDGYIDENVEIAGTTYTPEQIAMMRETGQDEMLQGLADTWATERNVDDDIARQEAANAGYLAQNPEYREYDEWRDEVYAHEDGVIGWWQEQADGGNQAAAAYLEDAQTADRPGDPKPTEAQVIGALTSPDGYLAAMQGVEGSVYQENLPPATPLPSGSTQAFPSQGSEEEDDPVASIESEIAEYRAEVARVSQVLIENGISPWVFELGTEEEQAAARHVLYMNGLTVPELSGDARTYIRWSNDRRERGLPYDVETFVAWQATVGAENAAATAPYYIDASGAGTLGEGGWNELLGGGGGGLGSGDPLQDFINGSLGPYGMEYYEGVGGSGQGSTYSNPLGARISRPNFLGGGGFTQLGGRLGSRIPR